MNKIWKENDIRKILEDISKKMGVDCSYMPIKISKRMTRCKGKCKCIKKNNNKVEGVEFRFSELLLNGNYPNEIVKEVIIHEYIHLYTNVTQNKFCKHNNYFKHNCVLAGIKPNTYFEEDESSLKNIIKTNDSFKYLVKCTGCGATFGRKRFNNGIDNFIKRYCCSKCRGKFEVTEIKK